MNKTIDQLKNPLHYYSAKIPSFSSLKYLITGTPLEFKRRYEKPFEASKAMIEGQLWHLALLEPEDFEESVQVIHYDDFRTKASKEERTKAEEKGKYAVLSKDYDKLIQQREELLESTPELIPILKESRAEVPILWNCADVQVKGRIDLVRENKEGINLYDFKNFSLQGKSMNDENVNDLLYWEVAKKLMHVQAGAYTFGLEDNTKKPVLSYSIIFRETTTNICIIREIPKDFVMIGYSLFRVACKIYKQCIESGVFNGIDNSKQEIKVSEESFEYFSNLAKELNNRVF